MNATKEFYEVLERMGVAAEFEARGIEEGLRLTATNLKKTGMPLNQIADVTGLPMAELEGL
ncbi:hypothetical protein AGMMS49940_08630 [Spirochaetia bacterium]|nr:hypothetical protein AGMMS49940_08630 [Spirochaetia bacterium]